MIRRVASLFILGLLASISSPVMADEDICAIPGAEFASCSPDFRAFHSIVVAIHGWNGSCEDTFGSDERSLLKTLKVRSAFDVDCFPYDTHNTSIAVSAAQLRTKIEALVNLGYDEFLFVTHSMGGVVLLQMLTEDALTADNLHFKDAAQRGLLLGDKGAHIAGIHAWAIPIKGLRDNINGPGRILNALGFSRAALPELDPDSPLLKSLNDRLLAFYRLQKADPSPDERLRTRMRLMMYQGKVDDWVVINFPSNDRLIADNTGTVRILDTQDGHSHNISNGGTAAEPRYAQEIMQDKTLLSMSLEPRFDDIFRSDLSSAPQSLVARQTRVIDGTLRFCTDNFEEAIPPTANLVARLMKGQFARSAELDFQMIDRFAALVEEQTDELSNRKRYVQIFDLYKTITSELGTYAPRDKQGAQDFGQGSSLVIDRVVKVFEYIQGKLATIVAMSQAEGAPIDPQLVASIQANILTALPQYLYSGHDLVRSDATNVLRTAMKDATPEAIAQSNLIEAVSHFAIRNGVDLPESERHALSDTLVEAARIDPAQRGRVFEAFNSTADRAAGNAQLWTVLMDDQRVSQTLTELSSEAQIGDPEFAFVSSVVQRGGAAGDSSSSALKALNVGQAAVVVPSDTPATTSRVDQLRDAAQSSAFPGVTQEFNRWQSQTQF